jgi:hypothetical protein
MRSITRLLSREGLPEKMRLEKQREMESLQGIAVENKQAERERTMAVRYHKVKFFERVKLTRAIEKLERDHPEATRGEAHVAELAQLREDLHYVMNFPKGFKYVSIIKSEGDAAYLDQKRARLRQIIRERMVAEAVLAEANEGGEAAAAVGVHGGAAKASVVDDDDFFMADDEDEGRDAKAERKKGGGTVKSPKEKAAAVSGSSDSSDSSDSDSDSDDEPKTKHRGDGKTGAAPARAKDDFLVSEDEDGSGSSDRDDNGDKDGKTSNRQTKVEGGGKSPRAGKHGDNVKVRKLSQGAPGRKSSSIPSAPAPPAPVAAAAPAPGKEPLRKREDGGRKRKKKGGQGDE